MKTINTSSLYILYVPLKKNLLKEKEQKNDRSNPHSYRVGINFANISAGIYPVHTTSVQGYLSHIQEKFPAQ